VGWRGCSEIYRSKTKQNKTCKVAKSNVNKANKTECLKHSQSNQNQAKPKNRKRRKKNNCREQMHTPKCMFFAKPRTKPNQKQQQNQTKPEP
jgi:hypothetical protein